MLILKAIPAATRTTRNGFVWPEVGQTVEAPDWDATPECGRGLHGWANGIGNIGTCTFGLKKCTWLVISPGQEVVDLDGKVKFRAGIVVFEGSMREAAAYIIDQTGEQGPVIGAHRMLADGEHGVVGAYGVVDAGNGCTVTVGNHCKVTVGNHCKVTVGNRCTVTVGNRCTVTAGAYCTVTAGDRCKVTVGAYCMVTAGAYCTVTAGNGCTVTAGAYSKVTAGDGCTVTAGAYSKVTAGNSCTVTAGGYCTVTAGDRCTVTAGASSAVLFKYYDTRARFFTAYVGEDDIEPNHPHKLDENHKLIKVEKE